MHYAYSPVAPAVGYVIVDMVYI